jgi:hypothetical protein
MFERNESHSQVEVYEPRATVDISCATQDRPSPRPRFARVPEKRAKAPAPLPVWRALSGIDPAAEHLLSRAERRAALLKLFQHFETQIRAALREHDENPGAFPERSIFWDPLPMVCGEMGIARRKMSAYARELTGMSANEAVDRIRAEKLPAALEAGLAEEIRIKQFAGRLELDGRWWLTIWYALAKSRRNPGFDRAAWAARYGFSSYTRMKRGCMLAHGGHTPEMLELKAIDAFAPYFAACDELKKKCEAWREQHGDETYDPEFDSGQRCDEEPGEPAFCGPRDLPWTRAQSERPEWLAAMREKLGLPIQLEDYADAVEAQARASANAKFKMQNAKGTERLYHEDHEERKDGTMNVE